MLVGRSFFEWGSSYTAFILAWIVLVPLWSTENVFTTCLKVFTLFWLLIISCLDTDCSKYWKNIWKEPYQSYFKATEFWMPREKLKTWKLKIWGLNFFIANLYNVFMSQWGGIPVGPLLLLNPSNEYIYFIAFIFLFSNVSISYMEEKSLKSISVSIFEDIYITYCFPMCDSDK